MLNRTALPHEILECEWHKDKTEPTIFSLLCALLILDGNEEQCETQSGIDKKANSIETTNDEM